jgi:tRNA(Arg) A34 adenosine deaminase TadA
MEDRTLLDRLLAAIEDAVLPLTRAGVAAGNKVFGAALLSKKDGAVILAETNNETENPLWHGEVHALRRFYEMPRGERPATSDLIFLSTHEPCTMCMSAITWAGFDNFFYVFSHEDSRDAFAIPHDLRILKEVFGLEPGGYQRTNAFWSSRSVGDIVASLPPAERPPFEARVAAIRDAYAWLSDQYQECKSGNEIPLS